MKIDRSQKICFKLHLKLILLFATCCAGLQGCEHSVTNSETAAEVIEDATGMIRLRADLDSSLFVIIPDFNPETSFALTGAYLPSDNLPEEYQVDSLRVFFCGEIVAVPAEAQLPAPPLRLICIAKTDFRIFRKARGTIKEGRDSASVYYQVIPDFDKGIAFYVSPAIPLYMPPDNLPDEFKQDGLRVVFNGEPRAVPPYVDPMHGTPLLLAGIIKL